ncbi:MAG: winged helix-turn-helix transcriptional regulator [Planctomycetales bacterium]|nr:winged helix-turn-helix transcriptional regulator [Planctomycetales bacterium]
MTDQLSVQFAALADPTRRAMLRRLAEGQASVSEIAKPFLEEMSLPAVTKHLKVLERAGMLTKTQDAQRRLCQLEPSGFKEIVDFLELYRHMMEESLDRLDAYLKSVTSKRSAKKDKHQKGKQADGCQK